MHIVKSTNKYEEWLRRRLSINEEDVQYKHERMADSPFEFMRATFYRWMQLWPEYCKELVSAPEVLTVGDLHTDNFGTWRDIEGRLVWGINDFDEAYPQAYTLDLVRLASSAALALSEDYSSTALPDLCQPILEGYRKGLRAGGAPFVLGQVADDWLLNLIIEMQKEPERFWEKLRELPKFEGELPEGAVAAIGQTLPEPGLRYRVAHRVAGLGASGAVGFSRSCVTAARCLPAKRRSSQPRPFIGLWRSRGRAKSSTARSSLERSAAPTPFWGCPIPGWCAASRLITSALIFQNCLRQN